jgi:hypothetical protein
MPSVTETVFTDLNVPLSRRVAETLLSHDADAFRLLNVAARGDVVYLSGLALGDESRDTAVELVRATAGVADVVDRVLVRPHPPRPTFLSAPAAPAQSHDSWQRNTTPLVLFALLVSLVAWQWTSILRAEFSAPDPPELPTPQTVAAELPVR